jgi:penicillin-binding protein 1A
MGFRGPEAHLDAPDEAATFVKRLRARYGPEPLADTERYRLALVREVTSHAALVDLGAVQARIPLRFATWAAPYDPTTGDNTATLGSLTEALEPGDVVWVRPTEDVDEVDQVPLVRLGQTPKVEAALHLLDHQRGYVRVAVGGVDYDRSQYNRNTQACRQPGSVFKAVYYALALDSRRFTMDSILEAKPWEPEPGEEWNPRNIDKTIDGKVLLRTAFIKSMNTPSIRVFVALGADEVVARSRRIGIDSELIADKGLSLGASCVRPIELSRSFSTYVRGGTLVDPTWVRRIVDGRGRTLVDRRDPRDADVDVAGRLDRMAAAALDAPEQVIDERTAWLITRLMREVVTAGTATKATAIGAPAGGKSGTASGRVVRDGKAADLTTDVWFVGFTSQEIVTAWMGFDDRNERSLGDLEASYTSAVPMWADFMELWVAGRERGPLPFERPPGITSRTADATYGGPPVAGMPTAQLYYYADASPAVPPSE